MKEHPILFTPDNAQKIYLGKKTQTRRAVQPRAVRLPNGGGAPFLCECPFGIPGDRLWVRESWRMWSEDSMGDADIMLGKIGDLPHYQHRVEYRGQTQDDPPWRHGMFMPRWASRTLLEITAVGTERVQSISHQDAIAEGCMGHNWVAKSPYILGPHTDDGVLPQEEFRDLWDSINKKRYPWSSNPWIWVIAFRKIPGEEYGKETGSAGGNQQTTLA